MEIVALSGIAILAAILAVMLKKYNPEYSILISLGAGAEEQQGLRGGDPSQGDPEAVTED